MKVYTTEEEQIERIKNWVKEYGTTVIVTLIVVIAISFGWRYLQNRDETIRAQASSAYEQVIISLMSGNNQDTVLQAKAVIKNYPSTPYAKLAGLILAQQAANAGNLPQADAQLKWVMQQEGGQDDTAIVARIRDARVLSAEGKNQQALALLSGPMPATFTAAAENVKGDIYLALGNKAEAKIAYQKALKASPRGDSMAPLVQMKLADLAGSNTSAQVADK